MKKKSTYIAKILKDCPKGAKLYSPLCGECYFDRINMGTIICKKQNTQEIAFTSEGYYMLPVFDDCECVLFPSKECRDWNKFQRPFKDGDILSYKHDNFKNRTIYIYMYHDRMNTSYYVALSGDSEFMINDKKGYALNSYNDTVRFATEEEKEKLFKEIEKNGYRWNAETKTLERLIKPKFKIGDKVKEIKGNRKGIIINIHGDSFYEIERTDGFSHVNIANQDEWELFIDKFNINILEPFDKVLGRSTTDGIWRCDFLFNIKKKWYL